MVLGFRQKVLRILLWLNDKAPMSISAILYVLFSGESLAVNSPPGYPKIFVTPSDSFLIVIDLNVKRFGG